MSSQCCCLPYEDGGPCNACRQGKQIEQLEKSLDMFVQRLKGQEAITDRVIAENALLTVALRRLLNNHFDVVGEDADDVDVIRALRALK
jgi:hypothetical protein